MSNRLNTLQNKPLRERVVEILRDAILIGELKPGQQLIETELATQLGISRAPLREALQQLNAEGLIEMVPYHGAHVRQFNSHDIEELYSLRTLLETFAAQRIIEQGDENTTRQLRQIFEEMRAAGEADDIRAVSLIDRNFHDAIIRLSGHTLLQTTWNVVSMRVRQVMALRNRRITNIREIALNHLKIVEAIEAKNTTQAVQLLEFHIASAGDLIVQGWDVFVEETLKS